MANEFIQKAIKVNTFPTPKNGKTYFYIRTVDGVYFIEDDENKLGNDKSEYSSLFYQAQNVIAQARLIEDQNQS